MSVKKVNSKRKKKGYKEKFQWNNWVKEIREQNGLTQAGLAARCGYSRDIICKIEQGKRKLDMDLYIELCNINSTWKFSDLMSCIRQEEKLNTEIRGLKKRIEELEKIIDRKEKDYQKLLQSKQSYYEKSLEYREKIKKLEGRS